MEQLIDRVNKLALPARVGIIIGIVLVVTGLFVYFMTWPTQQSIDKITVELKAKEEVLATKQALADNLTANRLELDKLEAQFQDALTQLPEKKEVDDLLAQIGDIGKKAGLEVAKVVPQAEQPENAFISRIPISVSVSGSYNEVAVFMQEISNLRRIVNVNQIKMVARKDNGGTDRVALASDFLATTFRFAEAKPSAKGKSGASKGAK